MVTMRRRLTRAGMLAAVILAVIGGPRLLVYAEERVEQPVKEAIDIRQKTQQQEESWRQERQTRLAMLEELEAEQKALQQQKTFLKDDIRDIKQRLADKRNQLDDIQQISEQIRPFLDELRRRLKAAMAADLAFLPDERQKRLAKIEDLLANPEVETSEKYRQMMEALLIEAEYGYTTEVYQDTIVIEGQKRLVNIFRLGRINLFYLTLNREQCGFYNVAAKKWQTLSGIHLAEIETAVDIATKRATAELLTLPLGRIVRP